MKRKRARPFGSKVASGKKDGRPSFIPTEDQKFLVTMMSSTGVPHERQAKALGVNSKTLRKYFKEELQLGRNRAIDSPLVSKLTPKFLPLINHLFFLRAQNLEQYLT